MVCAKCGQVLAEDCTLCQACGEKQQSNNPTQQPTAQKPNFLFKSASIKDILLFLLLPANPKGRGCAAYVGYPFALIVRLFVLVGIPLFFILGYTAPGWFVLDIILFLIFCPAISAIKAFNGKVFTITGDIESVKNKCVSAAKNTGATVDRSSNDDLLILKLAQIDKKQPPEVGIEFDIVQGTTYGRIFCGSGFYSSGGGKWLDFVANHGDGTWITMMFNIILLNFIRSFALSGSRKINKFFNTFIDELTNS